MRRFRVPVAISIIMGTTLAWDQALAQDAKVHTQLSSEQTEDLLKRLGIEFKNVDSKAPGVAFYDFVKKGHKIRLYNYDGKDLMLDSYFPKLPLEKINEWNVKAKFSRLNLQRTDKAEFTSLEANIDLVGGVTEGGLKQFFASFENELQLFVNFAGASELDERLFSPVTSEKIEAVLKNLKIAYEKSDLKNNGGQYYDFEASNFKIRLVNFAGKDLMIDAHFKKLPLEDINRWNLEKKFIRAVYYSVKGTEYTALESNLDCEVGTTEGILRNFIVGFQEDVKEFAKYVQDK